MLRALIYLPVLFILSSCSFTKIDSEEIASSILVTYKYSDQIPIRESADIILSNETNYCIIFPLKDGILIYTEQDGNQVVIENLVTVLGDQNLELSPKGESLSSRIITLRPDTLSLEKEAPTNFLVRITGYWCDNKDVQIVKEIPFTAIP